LGSILRGITTPADVLRGNIPTPYSGGAQPSQDVMSRATETASLISPMSPSYRAGVRYGTVTPLADDAWMPGWRGNLTATPIMPPTAREIKDAGSTQYNAVRGSNLETPSNLIGDVASQTQSQFGANFSAENAPKTFARLSMMSNPARSGSSMADLMAHYDELSRIIGTGGSDGLAARQARDNLQAYINNLGSGNTRAIPGTVPTMAAEDIAPTLATARGNTRAAMNANKVSGELDPAATGFIERAEGRSGTGRRALSDQLADRAGKILESNEQISALAPDEIAALRLVRDGTATQNILEWAGKRFGGLSPVSAVNTAAMSGAGFSGLGAKGVALGLVSQLGGTVAKAVANAMARGNTRLAEELMRRNSPLAQGLLAEQRLDFSPGIGRDQAVMRSLMPGLLTDPPPENRLPPGYI
jgi:hypothetical protein